jgi:hypothetical protein
VLLFAIPKFASAGKFQIFRLRGWPKCTPFGSQFHTYFLTLLRIFKSPRSAAREKLFLTFCGYHIWGERYFRNFAIWVGAWYFCENLGEGGMVVFWDALKALGSILPKDFLTKVGSRNFVSSGVVCVGGGMARPHEW